MSATYEIVRYRPDFRDAVARLLTHLLSPDQSVNKAYMAWKHEQNPYRREPLIYLARCGGEVVGMRSFLATRWEAGSPAETFEALHAGDFAIAPEHRDRGLVSRIMQTAFRELRDEPYPYAINLSAGRVTHLASLAAGWRSAGPVDPIGRRFLRAATLLRVRGRLSRIPFVGGLASRLAVRASGALAPFSRLDRIEARRQGRLGPRVMIGRTPLSEAMAELVSRLPFDGRIRHVRDERYFAWRFRNPLRNYRFLYWDEKRLEGYLVLQTGRPPLGRVHVVDWEARDEVVRADLLHAALDGGEYPELVAWATTLAPAARRLVEENGFRPVDREKKARGIPCVLVRPIREEGLSGDWTVAGRRLLDPADWDLRMIYSMHG
ncbi:MAG: GNAT family N-acetyltransferase [Thermoanaerobaculia bacterium]